MACTYVVAKEGERMGKKKAALLQVNLSALQKGIGAAEKETCK